MNRTRRQRSRPRSSRVYSGLVGLLAVVAVLGGACGSGDPQPPTATPLPIRVLPDIDAARAPLRTHTSSEFGYSIDIPEGWVLETGRVSGADLFVLEPEQRLADIQISSVEAGPDTTAETMVEMDVGYLRASGLGLRVPGFGQSVVVAGHPAKMMRYASGVAGFGLVIEQQAVYVVIDDRAWTIRFRLFNPLGDADGYFRLFARVLDSFRPL